jgi:hypothetical protein
LRRVISATLLAILAASPALARPATYEGTWAKTQAECKDEDGPNSRTYIALDDPKIGAVFDQYERHCRITARETAGSSTKLALRCHEFWEDFTKERNGQRATARLTLRGGHGLVINDARHVRCAR